MVPIDCGNIYFSLQVTTAAVEQYTGEGEPPYCEMTLRATDDNTTYNANFMVTLIGTPNNTIKIKRTLELLPNDGAQDTHVNSLSRLDHSKR